MMKAVDFLLKGLCQCPWSRVTKKYTIMMPKSFFFSSSEMCLLLKRFLRVLSFVDISIIFSIMFVLVSTYDPRYLNFLHDSLFLFFTLMLSFSVLILFIS